MTKTVEIGKVIKAKREEVGMSQADLSQKSGVSPSFINRLESGKRLGISISKLKDISTAMNVSVHEMIELCYESENDLKNNIVYDARYNNERVDDEVIDLLKVILEQSVVEIQYDDSYSNSPISVFVEKW